MLCLCVVANGKLSAVYLSACRRATMERMWGTAPSVKDSLWCCGWRESSSPWPPLTWGSKHEPSVLIRKSLASQIFLCLMNEYESNLCWRWQPTSSGNYFLSLIYVFIFMVQFCPELTSCGKLGVARPKACHKIDKQSLAVLSKQLCNQGILLREELDLAITYKANKFTTLWTKAKKIRRSDKHNTPSTLLHSQPLPQACDYLMSKCAFMVINQACGHFCR